jgi:hypothetical protein
MQIMLLEWNVNTISVGSISKPDPISDTHIHTDFRNKFFVSFNLCNTASEIVYSLNVFFCISLTFIVYTPSRYSLPALCLCTIVCMTSPMDLLPSSVCEHEIIFFMHCVVLIGNWELCHKVMRLNSNGNIVILSDVLGTKLLKLSMGSGNLPLLVFQVTTLEECPTCILYAPLVPSTWTSCSAQRYDNTLCGHMLHQFIFSILPRFNIILHFCDAPK